MPSLSAAHEAVEAALREERELVMSLGGYALELPGGVLVVNERIPVPRFNFVQYVRVHRNRQAAFFEKALDHYFQRALRPSIRVEQPVPEFLDATLRQLGFRPTPNAWSLLWRPHPPGAPPSDSPFEVRPARPDELPLLAGFWMGSQEREEFLRALAVALAHPNPDERLVPVIALRDGKPASAALLHAHRSCVGVHAVVTQPSERGQGAATALVDGLVRAPHVPDGASPVVMWSDSARLDRRLARLGFAVVVRYAVYELPPGAELALPAVGPSAPPRWRPARPRTENAG